PTMGRWYRSSLVAHAVARVRSGVFSQVVLVVLLGAVPGGGRLYGRRERPLPLPGRLDARLHALGRDLLLWRLGKNRGPILRPHVVALAVERGRVVQLEEPFLQQIFVAEHRGIERHADRLGVPRLAVLPIVVP